MSQAALASVTYQASFFGATATEFDFSGARRIALDAGSWIEHIPNWLGRAEAVFAELMETAPWLQRDRWMYTRTVIEPRLTADYPDVAEVPLDALPDMAAALSEHYGVGYRSLWVNL
jgi:hypothetical protein